MKHFRFVIVIAILIIAGSNTSYACNGRAASAAYKAEQIAVRNWFLGIGISIYDSTAWPDLRNPRRDVQLIYTRLCTDYYFVKDRSILLVDSTATKQNIIDTLRYLSKRMKPDDNLVIYYAGHGYYNDDTKMGFWIPCDGGENTASFLSTYELRLEGLVLNPGNHIVVFADACYSSGIFDDRAKRMTVATRGTDSILIHVSSIDGILRDSIAFGTIYDELEKYPSREAFVSGRLEKVTDGAGENSPFALYLHEYLSSGIRVFTVNEMADRVKRQVFEAADQLPRYGHLRDVGDEGGEFVFRRRN